MLRHAAIALAASLAFYAGAGDSCQSRTGGRGAKVEKPKTGADAASASPEQSPVTTGDPFASIPRVGVRELERALKEGRAVAVDVSPAEAYELEHIAGAISIPEDEIKERAGELPKGKLVVAYCS